MGQDNQGRFAEEELHRMRAELEQLRKVAAAARMLVENHGADERHILLDRGDWYALRRALEPAFCQPRPTAEASPPKHVISPNPHPTSTLEARAWEEGYWRGRRDLVEQSAPVQGNGENP